MRVLVRVRVRVLVARRGRERRRRLVRVVVLLLLLRRGRIGEREVVRRPAVGREVRADVDVARRAVHARVIRVRRHRRVRGRLGGVLLLLVGARVRARRKVERRASGHGGEGGGPPDVRAVLLARRRREGARPQGLEARRRALLVLLRRRRRLISCVGLAVACAAAASCCAAALRARREARQAAVRRRLEQRHDRGRRGSAPTAAGRQARGERVEGVAVGELERGELAGRRRGRAGHGARLGEGEAGLGGRVGVCRGDWRVVRMRWRRRRRGGGGGRRGCSVGSCGRDVVAVGRLRLRVKRAVRREQARRRSSLRCRVCERSERSEPRRASARIPIRPRTSRASKHRPGFSTRRTRGLTLLLGGRLVEQGRDGRKPRRQGEIVVGRLVHLRLRRSRASFDADDALDGRGRRGLDPHGGCSTRHGGRVPPARCGGRSVRRQGGRGGQLEARRRRARARARLGRPSAGSGEWCRAGPVEVAVVVRTAGGRQSGGTLAERGRESESGDLRSFYDPGEEAGEGQACARGGGGFGWVEWRASKSWWSALLSRERGREPRAKRGRLGVGRRRRRGAEQGGRSGPPTGDGRLAVCEQGKRCDENCDRPPCRSVRRPRSDLARSLSTLVLRSSDARFRRPAAAHSLAHTHGHTARARVQVLDPASAAKADPGRPGAPTDAHATRRTAWNGFSFSLEQSMHLFQRVPPP